MKKKKAGSATNSRFPFHCAFACGRAKQVSRPSKCLAENEPNAKNTAKTRRFGIATEIIDLNYTCTHSWLLHLRKLLPPTLPLIITVCMSPNQTMIVYGLLRVRNNVLLPPLGYIMSRSLLYGSQSSSQRRRSRIQQDYTIREGEIIRS
jgi:hypothetical protein